MEDERRHERLIKDQQLRLATGSFAPLFAGKVGRGHGNYLRARELLQGRLATRNDLTTIAQVCTKPDLTSIIVERDAAMDADLLLATKAGYAA